MITVKEIAWVAGLLEGEGCFFNHKNALHAPVIQLRMNDLDVIEQFQSITKWPGKISVGERPNDGNDYYSISVYGNLAAQWMMTIYTLMCSRRKEKIREVLVNWKSKVGNKGERVKVNVNGRMIPSVRSKAFKNLIEELVRNSEEV